MKRLGLGVVLGFALTGPGWAQEDGTSPFGDWDRQGASVLMNESKAIEAANLIRRGRVIPLGRDYSDAMPMRKGQKFTLTGTDVAVRETDEVVFYDGQLTATIGQMGTRLVGLGHMRSGGPGGRFYNDLQNSDVVGENGLIDLGIEHVKPFFTRGIMIDMVTQRGGPMEAGDEITVADIEAALDWHELREPGLGDVVVFHTGWGRHWLSNGERYLSGAPGIGAEAVAWLIERRVALVASDSWSVPVQPSGGPYSFALHLELLQKNGIFLHENLETERLIDAEIAEFAYIFAPLKVEGATGSPGEPLAVY